MPDANTAERLLCLFATQERAAEIVGDLEEERPTRGTLWFWTTVFETMLRFFFHDLRCMARLCITMLAIGVVVNFLSRAYIAPGIVRHTGWYGVAIAWGILIGPFLTGLLLARLARGHELTIGLVFAVAGYIFQLLLTNDPRPAFNFSGIYLIQAISVFSAALLMRRACTKRTRA